MLKLLTDTKVNLEHPDTRHGFGLFETVRVTNGIPIRLDEHLARLAAGAQFLGIDCPPDQATILAFLANNTDCGTVPIGVLRLIAVSNNLYVTIDPQVPPRPKMITLGISNNTVRFTRNRLNRFKTTSYIENRLMMQEAKRRNLYEVIALNENSYLADGSRTNLFLVVNDLLLTPPLADGALPGIARKVLIDAKLATEVSINSKDLHKAEAVILTNALYGAIAVDSFYGDQINKLDISHSLIQQAVMFLNTLSP